MFVIFRLVIGDDEEIIRNGLKNLVESFDLDLEVVGLAENGLETLELIDKYSPEILLLDINMPYMNGLETIEKIREKNSEMKIIIISGYSEFAYAQKAVELGVYSYLLKPIDYKDFKRILENAMEDYNRRLWEINLIKEEKKSEKVDIIDYIKIHFTDRDMSLSKVAEDLFLSQSYVSKNIKDRTKYSFTDYVNKLRMEMSIGLLLDEEYDYSIKEIAEKTGYSSQHYFSRAFKNYSGLSPVQYKQKYKNT